MFKSIGLSFSFLVWINICTSLAPTLGQESREAGKKNEDIHQRLNHHIAEHIGGPIAEVAKAGEKLVLDHHVFSLATADVNAVLAQSGSDLTVFERWDFMTIDWRNS
jgi:hypothetical protein